MLTPIFNQCGALTYRSRVPQGEVKEDVYLAQVKLQADLEELFEALDKAKGQATGFIPKEDLRAALMAYYKVGSWALLLPHHCCHCRRRHCTRRR